jgi:hypothetical protein
MEKQFSVVGYWLGLTCTVVALIFRILSAFNLTPLHIGASEGNAIGYLSFLHGAELFFLLSIASWCRTAKS